MKTIAIRLEDELHAQLSVLAQLQGTSLTDEIRQAIEAHLERSRNNPDLTTRAQSVLDDIEREVKARQAAIATLFGSAEPSPGARATGRKGGPGGSEGTGSSS
jgi:predicted DNA-binding protein